jgi:hypothetical protein
LTASHRKSLVPIVAEWCNDGTQVLGCIIQFKSIVLHTDIQFSEVFVSTLPLKDNGYLRQRIDFAFVEGNSWLLLLKLLIITSVCSEWLFNIDYLIEVS